MINVFSKADKTSTVEQFIDMKSSDENTYYNYSILEYMDGIEFFVSNVLYDYQDELEDQCVELVLTESNMNKYRYKPYLLAYDIYGSVEAVFIINMMNGIVSDIEFDFNRVKIIHPDSLSAILGRIYSANVMYINNNISKLKDDIKKDTDGNRIWNS